MSNSATLKTRVKEKKSLKFQAIATLTAVVCAVAVPQLVHVMGALSGLGTSLGETFLPMHFPIIIVGLIAGPVAGAVSGFFGPLVSFALSGMPGIVMLPFMMAELCAYGLFAGLLRNINIPTVVKVLITQVAGRAVRAVAILVAFYGFGYQKIAVPVIWKSIGVGVIGIVGQIILIPLIIYRVENIKKHEK